MLGTLGWISDKKNSYDEFATHMDEAIKFQRNAVEKRPRHREYKDRLQGQRQFFVTQLLAAMDSGFQTDLSDSRFDTVRDDPEFHEALQRLKSPLPDADPVSVLAE